MSRMAKRRPTLIALGRVVGDCAVREGDGAADDHLALGREPGQRGSDRCHTGRSGPDRRRTGRRQPGRRSGIVTRPAGCPAAPWPIC